MAGEAVEVLIQKKAEEMEQIVLSYLPKQEGMQKTVMEAMHYSVMAGGKRLRPMMMMEAFTLCGGTNTEILKPFLAAMEMIHTYSLVHDDLPAMDNDEYRRGKKTTHIVYGEDIGILAGDALLNFAFETAQKAFYFCASIEEYQRVAKALGILAQKAGIYGMLGGQVVDVENTGKPLSREQLDFIYRLKTGALLEASLLIGTVLAGADKERQDMFERAGTLVGLAFQIQDDILDMVSTTKELGKPVHSDEKNKKTTYVTLEGMEKAKQDVEKASKEAVDIMAHMGFGDSFLCDLFRFLIDRRK
jgi:geranylgeranyl diphosphate synthase type II